MKPEFTRNPDPKPELEKYDQNLGLFKLWFGSYKNPASVIQIWNPEPGFETMFEDPMYSEA